MAEETWDNNLPDDLFSGLNIPGDTIDTSKPDRIGLEEEDVNWQDELRREDSMFDEAPSKKKRGGRKSAPVTDDYTVSDDTSALVSLAGAVNKPTVDASLDDMFVEEQQPEFGDLLDETDLPPAPASNDDPFDLPASPPFGAEPADLSMDFGEQSQPFDDPFGPQSPDGDFNIDDIDIDGTIGDAQQTTKRRKRIIGGLTAVALIIGVAFGASWLLNFGAQRGLADVSDDIDLSFIAEPAKVDTTQPSGEFRANGTPIWELDAEEARLMSIYRAGILQIHDGKVKLRNINTGDVIEETKIDEAVESTYETFDEDGNPAVGYRTDSQITVISKAGVQSWDVDSELDLVATGNIGLLVDSHSYTAKAVVPGEEELVVANYDENLMLSGADQDYLLQPISNTPRVELVDFDGEGSKVIELAPPHEKTTFIRHLSIGHGISLALWDLEDVRLATTHSLEDGRALSTVPVEAAEKWTFGRGADLAVMGRYALEISTGHFTVEADKPLSGAVNTVPFIEESGSRIIIVNGKPLRQSNRLRGVTESVVVIENGDSSISVYPHTGSPDEQSHGGGLA